MTRTDPNVNFNWAGGGPGPGMTDNFMARWSGEFTPPRGGIPYTFYAAHDDGIRIWVDDQLILNSWRDQSTNGPGCGPDTCGNITLANTDPVKITIEYYDHSGTGFVTVGVIAPIGPANAIVTTALEPSWLSDTDNPAPLPAGWTLSPSSGYVGARLGEGSASLTDPVGGSHRWAANNPGFSPPPGEDGVVGTDGAGAMTVHDGGLTSVFDSAGRLRSTSGASDDRVGGAPNPASVAYGWSGTPERLRTLTDPVSGRALTVSYSGDGACPSPPTGFDAAPPASMICAVTYPDGTQTKLWYVNSQLARIEDPGAAKVDFAYAGGLLTKVRDPLVADAVDAGVAANDDTTRTVVVYDSASRVQSVTLAAPGAGAPRPAHSYPRPTTSQTEVDVTGLTQPAGYARLVTYDAAGRTTAERDALGRETTTTWEGDAAAGPVPDRPTSVTDPAGRMSTALYDAAGRVTDRFGPAPTSCFNTTTRQPNGTCPPVAHSATVHDGTVAGLASMYWPGSGRVGNPGLHQTGVGDASGAHVATWSTPPGGLGSPWSARFEGEVTLHGDSKLQVRGAGGAANWGSAALWVDDVLTPSTQSVPDGVHRISIDYNPGTAPSIQLDSRPALSGSFAAVPGTDLRPRYGLVTKTTTDDDGGATPTMVTDTAYGPSVDDPGAPDAAAGLAARTTTDPGGLGLATVAGYEPPGAGRFLRPTSRTLPAGNATTYAYYGATATLSSNPCVASSVSQAGLRRFATDPDPDGGGSQVAKVTELAYDVMGRTAGTRIGAEAWSCVVRDPRGRVTSATVAGPPARTVTYDYDVGLLAPNPLVTSIADPAGTITTTTDLLGRIKTYVDATGHSTTTTYDQPGRVTDTAGPQGALHVEPDAAGRPLTQSLDATVVATPAYNGPGGELSGVTYANGSTLASVGRDQAGRTTTLSFNQAGGPSLVADSVTRSRSGRVVDETIDGADANPLTGDAGANFRYDGAGRLTEAWVPTQHLTYAFSTANSCGLATAGANSNRTSTTTNGGTLTTY